MQSRVLCTWVLLAGVGAPAVAGELFPYRVKARRRCGLPCYEYDVRPISPPIVAGSFPPIAVEPRLIGTEVSIVDDRRLPPKMRIRAFQFATSRLQINHCLISNVAVTLREDGRWTVNLLAAQNPSGLPPEIAIPAMRFRRNRFFVTVRAYGVAEALTPAGRPVLGQPELFRLEPPGFWVEQGEVVEQRLDGLLPPDLARQFDRVARVEVELRYEE